VKYFNRIGGRHAITLRAWLILLPLSMFGTISFTPEGPRGVTALLLAWFVGLLVHLLTGPVLLLARLTYLHDGDRKPRPISAIATLATAGVVRGYSVAFLFEYFGVVAQADYLERMIAGAVLTVILFGGAAILVDSQSAYREAAARLEAERAQAQQLAREGERKLAEQRELQLALVRKTLSESLQSARSREQLHEAVDQVVRPLSHNLARLALLVPLGETAAPTTRVRLRPAIRAGLAGHPFNIAGTLLIAMTATAYSRFWAFGWLAAIDLALMALTVILGFRVFRRLRVQGWWALGAIQLVGILSATFTYLLIGANPVTQLASLVLLSFNIAIPAVGIAFFKGFEQLRAERLVEMGAATEEAKWQRSLIQSRAWVEQQRLGRFVHSELQGRIRATALRASTEHGDVLPAKVVGELEEECLRAIDLTVDEPDLEAFMANTVELWQGVADVSFDLAPAAREALAADPWATSALIEISREAISNASKHGSATSIQIAVDEAEGLSGALRFQASDNGTGQSAAKKPIEASGSFAASATGGLGLATIAEFTLESELTLTDSGAVLSALIATRPAALAV
jgi:signal transduction histidine kinase